MPPTAKDYLKRISGLVLGPGTLRNQGAPGVNTAARDFLSEMDLTPFGTNDRAAFMLELDTQTEALRLNLPRGAQRFGTARKAINLVLAEAYLNRYLYQEFSLGRAEDFFEVPLDRQTVTHLRKFARASNLQAPSWLGIIYLDPEDNMQFQSIASRYVENLGPEWKRVHLDTVIWRRGA